MGRMTVASATVLVIVFILAGTLGSTRSASQEKYTISIETMGVTFELPKGYAVFQREYKAPDYFTAIDFGKEFRAGHLKNTGLEIEFSLMAHDSSGDYVPSKYVDMIFDMAKRNKWRPKYIELFGNKAVRYNFTSGKTAYMFIVGYLRGDQLPLTSAAHRQPEYHVRITNVTSDGQFSDSDKQLLDTVIGSLRIIK